MAKRYPTKYPGVYYIEGVSSDGRTERIYYIKYSRGGKVTEEPVGRQFRDDMTPARASLIRTRRIEGGELSNKEQRHSEKSSGITLDQVYEEYVEHKNHKPSTCQPERAKYVKYIQPEHGKKCPSLLTQKDFDTLLKRLKDENKAPQTIKHVIGLLSRLIKYSSEKGYCQQQRFRYSLPKINNEKTEMLTPEQIKKLIEVMDSDDHPFAGKLMKLALFTGMRAGELFKLEWRDIDFDNNFITIREPKAGKDKVIPLSSAARELIGTIPRSNNQFVFPAREGHQRKGIVKQSRRIRDDAGLPKDFRPLHGLRHVFASTLASNNVELYTIQKLLTHSDPKTTQRYAHLRDETLKNAADLAGKLFEDKE